MCANNLAEVFLKKNEKAETRTRDLLSRETNTLTITTPGHKAGAHLRQYCTDEG